MDRRELIKSLSLISGHVLFPSVLTTFVVGCAHKDMKEYVPVFFNPEEYRSVKEIIDIIIPATVTSSASQVNTHVFLDQVFAQCTTEKQQQVIRQGLTQMLPGWTDAKDKTVFLSEIDRKAYGNDADQAWFRTLKKFTLIGFFTSQEGTTKASNYVKVPDVYKGEITADGKTLNYGKTNLSY